jgi:putative PEP-CTERM system TPR-repeat lipoprotein
MNLNRLVFALALAWVSLALPGCDNTSKLTVQEHIQRAKDFEDQGKLRGSVVELKNAVQKNPDNAQARLLLGQIYLKLGQGAEAEKELRQAGKHGVSQETLKPLLGEALLMMGEYKQILDEIQPSEKTSQLNAARIYQLRADALFNQRNFRDACALYQKSMDVDTGNAPTYWGLAQCALLDNDLASSRTWLDAALKLKDREAQTWVLIGNLELFGKRRESAVAAYTNALRIDPNHLEALESRSTVYMALGQLDAAKKDIEQVNAHASKSTSARYLRALLDFEQKNYPAALGGIQDLLKFAPDYMPGILLAGSTSYATGAYQQAESYLNRYLERFPRNAYAIRVLAATQIKLNQPDKSLGALAPLLAQDSPDTSTLSLAGQALLLKGESDKATAYFQRAAALDPQNTDIQTQIGISHLAAGDNQTAIAELSKAAAMDAGEHRADVLLIMTLLDLKEFDKALAAIDALGRKLPQNAMLQTMRGNVYLGKSDPATARKHFEEALSITPTFYPAAMALAQLDLADKKPDAARQRFERMLDKDRTHLQAMLALAELAAANNQEAASLEWLEKAAKAHPNALQPRAILVRRYLSRNEPQRALVIANEAVNANPNNPAALDLLGSAQLASQDRTSATSTYTRLAQLAEQSPESLVRLAYAQTAAGRLAEARNTLEKGLKSAPNHPQLLDVLLRLEMRQNHPDKALELARRIQSAHPALALGFEREGDIQLNLKKPDLAAKFFEKAQSIAPETPVAIKLHRALTLAGKPLDADRYLAAWIKGKPDDMVARGYLAETQMAAGKDQDAIASYQRIVQSLPNNAIALNNLAGLYQRRGDPRARATAEQALKLDPDNPAVQDTAGWILVEQGEIQRGLEQLRKAIAKLPRNENVRYHHAVALARSGDTAAARKELEQLLRDAPRSPLAPAIRGQLDSL